MKNNKKILFVGVAIVILVFLAIISKILLTEKFNTKKQNVEIDNTKNGFKKLDIYYLNKSNNQLIPENRELFFERENFLEVIFEAMKEQPKVNLLTSVLPSDLEILNYKINPFGILQVNFSKDYNNMKKTDEIFFYSAFVWTVTGLDFIKDIEIFVQDEPIKKGNGEEMGYLNRDNVILNPVISPDNTEIEEVTLYFADEQLLGLLPEKRLVKIKQSIGIETQLMEQLIEGPKNKGSFPTVPTETKIRNIKTEGGICYVDLSNEFITKHSGGSSAEILTIYSIVNTLTEITSVKKVQFLIEGEKINIYKGHLDISKPLDRDELIILK